MFVSRPDGEAARGGQLCGISRRIRQVITTAGYVSLWGPTVAEVRLTVRAHWGVQRLSSRRKASDRFEGDGEDACGGPGEVREDVRVVDEVDILSRVHDLHHGVQMLPVRWCVLNFEAEQW